MMPGHGRSTRAGAVGPPALGSGAQGWLRFCVVDVGAGQGMAGCGRAGGHPARTSDPARRGGELLDVLPTIYGHYVHPVTGARPAGRRRPRGRAAGGARRGRRADAGLPRAG
jgi:hypothetical protein